MPLQIFGLILFGSGHIAWLFDSGLHLRTQHGLRRLKIGPRLFDLVGPGGCANCLNLSWNPVRDYKKPDNDYEVIDPPTEEDAQKILEAATPTLARAYVLAFYMGLRPGAVELLTLTWPSVNFRRETILVISADKGGADRRHVPIHEDLLPILKAWKKADANDQGHIIHYRGKPITKLQKSWERALAKAGIKRRIRPYDLRHHFITRALEEGGDLKALSEVVGSSPETIWRTTSTSPGKSTGRRWPRCPGWT